MKFKTFAYWVIVFLLLAGMFISKRESTNNIEIYGSNFRVHLRNSANSERIHINNNWTEVKAAGICTGEGTGINPYILKNLIIDAEGVGQGIYIENTIEYFKIENCEVFNSGGNYEDSGIRLYNVTNGRILNNTMYDNYRGMSIWLCLNLTIVRNRLYNDRGLQLLYSNDSIFYLNTFINSNYDIFLQWSDNQYNSQEKFSYTYNGRTFTNYLGNHWSIYDGSDNDGDGIGDIPMIIDPYVVTNPRLRDYYPLIEPLDEYSNIKIADALIPGFNLFSLLGVVGIITILLAITNRKALNKSK